MDPRRTKGECGTLPYMAKEIFTSSYGPKVDVYALGCLARELLTGVHVFDHPLTAIPEGWTADPPEFEEPLQLNRRMLETTISRNARLITLSLFVVSEVTSYAGLAPEPQAYLYFSYIIFGTPPLFIWAFVVTWVEDIWSQQGRKEKRSRKTQSSSAQWVYYLRYLVYFLAFSICFSILLMIPVFWVTLSMILTSMDLYHAALSLHPGYTCLSLILLFKQVSLGINLSGYIQTLPALLCALSLGCLFFGPRGRLTSLVDKMIAEDPKDRPTIQHVESELRRIHKHVSEPIALIATLLASCRSIWRQQIAAVAAPVVKRSNTRRNQSIKRSKKKK